MRVFITGMTGTLGTALAKEHHARGDAVFGCARNEQKCVEWIRENHKVGTLYCCDCEDLVKDATDISMLLPTLNCVYHCAAMKHVDMCEMNPAAATYENIVLPMHLSAFCVEEGVRFIFVSSDKACLPIGVYGATKLLAEKITTSNGGAAIRLGNLIGSSGSVFQLWNQAVKERKPIHLSEREMTRFFYPIREAVNFLIDHWEQGCVVVPAGMKSARMGDVADVYARTGVEVRITGKRAGETSHQYLIAPDSQVDCTPAKYILYGNQPLPDGLYSGFSPRWDIRELLEEAGVPNLAR